jgi:hypothetical protein
LARRAGRCPVQSHWSCSRYQVAWVVCHARDVLDHLSHPRYGPDIRRVAVGFGAIDERGCNVGELKHPSTWSTRSIWSSLVAFPATRPGLIHKCGEPIASLDSSSAPLPSHVLGIESATPPRMEIDSVILVRHAQAAIWHLYDAHRLDEDLTTVAPLATKARCQRCEVLRRNLRWHTTVAAYYSAASNAAIRRTINPGKGRVPTKQASKTPWGHGSWGNLPKHVGFELRAAPVGSSTETNPARRGGRPHSTGPTPPGSPSSVPRGPIARRHDRRIAHVPVVIPVSQDVLQDVGVNIAPLNSRASLSPRVCLLLRSRYRV